MKSIEYRQIIKVIIKNLIRKKFPGLKQAQLVDDLALEAARAVHARMYGANVDGVETPIWRDHPFHSDDNFKQPTRTAQELLNE